MNKRDIRKSRWYEEISEYLGLDQDLIRRIASAKMNTDMPGSEDIKIQRRNISEKFMSEKGLELYGKITGDIPGDLNDNDRSESWKEYIFVCINGEKKCFQRMELYERLIKCIVKPMLDDGERLTVMDYGCGSSLFTRLLSQDFSDRIETISCDVCKYAVDYSVSRNQLYNPAARGILIDDVLGTPDVNDIDLILAYAVFEHLPNSAYQIQELINSLAPGGILVENYAGHSSRVPHKSDTFNSYKCRNSNLDMLRSQLFLLHGDMPACSAGVYEEDCGVRIWIKDGYDKKLKDRLAYSLRINNMKLMKFFKGFKDLCRKRFNG